MTFQVKIPLESSKDTRDYKDNVLDNDNTNGIGGQNLKSNRGDKSGKSDGKSMFGANGENKENENDKNDGKLLANAKQARVSIDVQINH